MLNWNRIKLAFEGISPSYYHGKRFARLEDDLQQGFLHGYINDYIDAMVSVGGFVGDNPKEIKPVIYLTRDRLKKGKFISGLQQVKIFSERDREGIIYVFNSNLVDLFGYRDDEQRNIVVKESIPLHKLLERIIINSYFSTTEEKVRDLLKREGYWGVGVCQLSDWQK